ncbi:MAG: DUF4286 family protein [Saprospiraceae bacterium]|nr:DUF4286 family protein [Saprospiraceae bacterium]
MKILYNVTVIVDDTVVEDWKQWMVKDHIPKVMETGAFETYQLQKVLTEGSEGGTTFAVQYLAHNREAFEKYQMQNAPKLQKEHQDRYNGKFGAFRTIMEVLSAG